MLNPVRNIKAQGSECKISNGVKNFLNHFLNIIYPKTCLICHNSLENNAIDNLLCLNCWLKIKRNKPPLCTICGRQIREKQIYKKVCQTCLRQNFSFDRAFSPCIYEGLIRQLIHKLKYQRKNYLSSFLARLLIEFICQHQIPLGLFDLVIPIPLHKIRLREREFNQVEPLASRVAEEFSLRFCSTNLWRKRHRVAQMELKGDKRWENIKSCFDLRNPAQVRGKNILLVDDVLTTGATCSEAASVLKSAGAISVFVLTLAN